MRISAKILNQGRIRGRRKVSVSSRRTRSAKDRDLPGVCGRETAGPALIAKRIVQRSGRGSGSSSLLEALPADKRDGLASGLKGTVVSFPHCGTIVVEFRRAGSTRWRRSSSRLRFDFARLTPLGLVLEPLSGKNSCSPAVKTKSAPQSLHLRTLSRTGSRGLKGAPLHGIPG